MTSSEENKDIDYYKYLYKYERGASSTYIQERHSKDSPSITPPLPDNPLSASVICGLTPSISASSAESMESPSQVLQKGVECTETIHMNECPPFVVDPLSLMTKLAELSKKRVGTKISIMNHEIVIHEPGMFQGIVRYYNNSNKHDLRYLQVPIEIACTKYIILPKDDEIRVEFVKLFQEAARGLEILAKTYESDPMVVMCINQYMNIIHNSISMKSIILSKDIYGIRKYYGGT